MVVPAAAGAGRVDGEQAPAAGGLLGPALSVMDVLEELGVGLLIALESIVPPVPSEAVLPLAGFLARTGAMSLPLVVLAATLGSVTGALVLRGATARVGLPRLRVWARRVPGTSVAGLDRAVRWFDRKGSWAVLLGRCVPIVRSLVSVPAGASAMSRRRFVVLTAVGSAVWNTLFIGAGYLLSSRWEQVAAVGDTLTWVVVGAAALLVLRSVARRVHGRRRAQRAQRSKTASTSGIRDR